MSLFIDLISEFLGRGHSVRFRANGKSMHPTIKDGEEIVVEPVAPSHVKRGDIILYQRQRGVIAHRIVGIGSDHHRATTQPSALSPRDVLLLRGDATDFPDEPVEVSRILGKVVAVERDGRRIRLDTRSATLLSAICLRAARLRRAMSRRLPRAAHLLRTCRDLFRAPLKASA